MKLSKIVKYIKKKLEPIDNRLDISDMRSKSGGEHIEGLVIKVYRKESYLFKDETIVLQQYIGRINSTKDLGPIVEDMRDKINEYYSLFIN